MYGRDLPRLSEIKAFKMRYKNRIEARVILFEISFRINFPIEKFKRTFYFKLRLKIDRKKQSN